MRFSALVPMLQTMDIKHTTEWYNSVLGITPSKGCNDGWTQLTRDQVKIPVQ